MTEQHCHSGRPRVSPVLAVVLAVGLLSAGDLGAQQPDSGGTPLDVMSFYVGEISSGPDSAGAGTGSRIALAWGVGRQLLRFRGIRIRGGAPSEFVSGLMAWDPVDRVIRINAMFLDGAYFSGVVDVLDAEHRVVQRQWTGHYPDGRVVEYRETWTPVSLDRFEWNIEFKREDRWIAHRRPGVDRPPVFRVIRGNQ